MPRLLYFTRAWTGHDQRIVRGLCDEGWEVGVATCDRVDVRSSAPSGIRALGEVGWDAPAEVKFAALVETFAPAVILAGPLTDAAAIAVQAARGVPVVGQCWAFDVFWEFDQSRTQACQVSRALQGCAGLWVDCRAAADRCRSLVRSIPAQVYCAPWGLEAAWRRPAEPQMTIADELELDGRTVFLHTRTLDPLYAPEVLLDAWRSAALPGALLLLAGGGALRAELGERIARARLTDSVRLLGPHSRERLWQLYQAADVYVSCARCDGTSLSLLEAMAAGLPAIVPAVGGNPEWIASGENGWLTAVGDAASVRAALGAAHALTPAARNAMGNLSRQHVERHAQWEVHVAGLSVFLQTVASAGISAARQ